MADWSDVGHLADINVALRRLLAIAFAIVVVIGAFVFRNWRDSGGTVSLTGDGPTIVCDALIEDACRQAFGDIRVAEPGVTFEQLLADSGGDSFVWIAGDVWFDMIEDERSRGAPTPAFGERSGGLAHSPLVFAGPGIPACVPVSFSCLADRNLNADLGIEDRFDTSAGLIAFGQLAFERNSRSNQDLRWSESDGAELNDGDTRTLLNYQNAGGRYDLVIVAQATFDTLGPDDVAITAADTPVAVTIEAVVIGDGGLPALGDLGDALNDSAWTTGPAPAFDGPSAGGLIALRGS